MNIMLYLNPSLHLKCETGLSPSVKYIYFYCGSLVLFMSCVCHAFVSVHCCLVVTRWERADLLALVFTLNCVFVTFPCGILGQMWYLIVSIPDLCRLSNFQLEILFMKHYAPNC